MAENVTLGKKSIEETSKAFDDINRSIDSTSKTAKEISGAAGENALDEDAAARYRTRRKVFISSVFDECKRRNVLSHSRTVRPASGQPEMR
jgi:hypothetical protein